MRWSKIIEIYYYPRIGYDNTITLDTMVLRRIRDNRREIVRSYGDLTTIDCREADIIIIVGSRDKVV